LDVLAAAGKPFPQDRSSRRRSRGARVYLL
jgi:hypothetical protein